VFVPYEVAYEENFEDMPRRVPSISKVQQAIGWRPQFDLDTTLASVIEYAQATESMAVTVRPARRAQTHRMATPTKAMTRRAAASVVGHTVSPARTIVSLH